jgi:hypothetical protein
MRHQKQMRLRHLIAVDPLASKVLLEPLLHQVSSLSRMLLQPDVHRTSSCIEQMRMQPQSWFCCAQKYVSFLVPSQAYQIDQE